MATCCNCGFDNFGIPGLRIAPSGLWIAVAGWFGGACSPFCQPIRRRVSNLSSPSVGTRSATGTTRHLLFRDSLPCRVGVGCRWSSVGGSRTRHFLDVAAQAVLNLARFMPMVRGHLSAWRAVVGWRCPMVLQRAHATCGRRPLGATALLKRRCGCHGEPALDSTQRRHGREALAWFRYAIPGPRNRRRRVAVRGGRRQCFRQARRARARHQHVLAVPQRFTVGRAQLPRPLPCLLDLWAVDRPDGSLRLLLAP